MLASQKMAASSSFKVTLVSDQATVNKLKRLFEHTNTDSCSHRHGIVLLHPLCTHVHGTWALGLEKASSVWQTFRQASVITDHASCAEKMYSAFCPRRSFREAIRFRGSSASLFDHSPVQVLVIKLITCVGDYL